MPIETKFLRFLDGTVWNFVGTENSDAIVENGENALFLAGDNVIDGYGGNDWLEGGAGKDTIRGGSGSDTIFGGTHDDKLFGGSDNDLIYGGSGNDYLDGGTGSDSLYGGLGNDTLDGGAGDAASHYDRLEGGDGHDVYRIRDARDVIYGEQSYATSTSHDLIELYMNFFNMADVRGAMAVEDVNVMGNVLNGAYVNGNTLDNEMRGNVGNDTLAGGSGNDEIFGKDGNDMLSGGIGNDFLSGDAGNDFIDGGNDQDTIYGGSGNDSLWGASGNDVIYGGSEDDVLKGEDGNDYLDGGSGFDRMDGGAGNDTLKGGEDMAGGEGNDTFYVVDAAQIVTEALNEGQDVVRTTLTEYTLGANLEELVYEGNSAASVSFEGNAGDNYITARNSAHAVLWGGDGSDDLHGSNTGYDQLYGGDGDDILYGYGGDDFINGGTGRDYMRGGTGNDTYVVDSNLDRIIEYANEGYDIARITNQYFKLLDTSMVEELQASTNNGHMIYGNMHANTIRGLNGEDVLQGFDGNDYLVGNGGNDSLDGGSGNDMMLGGYGNDTYWIDSQYDKIVEYSTGGFDTAYIKNSYYSFVGSENVERMIASSSWDTTIHGTNGHNRILGGTKNDLLSGRGGNDNIHGGGGADRVYGGTGSDQFIFQNNRSNTGSKVMDFVHGEDKIVLDSDGQWGWAAMGNGTVVIQSGNGGGSITVYADNLYYGSDIQLMSDATIANLI